jgi:hypothetical protein
MNRLTRAQAVEQVGGEAVMQVETESVDFTNRLTDGTPHNGWAEFASAVATTDKQGESCTLTMYVYIDSDHLVECEDLSYLNWDAAIADAEFVVA